jgi:hypothetical protein
MLMLDDLRRREFPVLTLVYLLTLLFAWLGAGQEIAGFPAWIARSVDLSVGYSDAMARGFFTPYSLGVVAVFYLSVSTLMMTTIFVALKSKNWKLSLLPVLFTLFLCAVSIKHSMGGNQAEQALVLLVVMLWFIVLVLKTSAYNEEGGLMARPRMAYFLSAMTFLLLVVFSANVNFPIRSLDRAIEDFRRNTMILHGDLEMSAAGRWQSALDSFHRFRDPIPEGATGTIDVYPHHTGLVIGNGSLRYAPRPAFLSLNAHTYDLALLNARYLESEDAPDWLWFKVLPRAHRVNNRHPALDDGPSWPLLLSRYRVDSIGGEFVLLKKRTGPLVVQRELKIERSFNFGEEIALPESNNSLVWLELKVERSFIGYLIHTLYKSPHLLIESSGSELEKQVHQVVPELGRAGFLVSPLVLDNPAFIGLFGGGSNGGSRVETVVINSPEAPAYFWTNKINVKIFSFKIGGDVIVRDVQVVNDFE